MDKEPGFFKKYFKHIIILILFAVMVPLASGLSNARLQYFPVNLDRPQGVQIITEMIGEIRTIIASYIFIRADMYHHERETKVSWNKDPATLPLHRIVTALDPKFEKAYDFGAYHLAVNFEKYDEAIKFLKEGLHYNPDSYTLNFTMGDIFYYRDPNKLNVPAILNWPAFLEMLKTHDNPLTARIWDFLGTRCEEEGKKAQSIIENWTPGTDMDRESKEAVVLALNKIISSRFFFDRSLFLEHITLAPEAREILQLGMDNLGKKDLRIFNRELFNQIFPGMIAPVQDNEYRTAIKYHLKALKLAANVVEQMNALRRLYWEYRQLGKYEEAGKFLAIMKEIAPRDSVTIKLDRELNQLISGEKTERDFVKKETSLEEAQKKADAQLHHGHSHSHEHGHDHSRKPGEETHPEDGSEGHKH